MKKSFKKIGLLLFLGICGINTLFASEKYSVKQVNQFIKENSILNKLNDNRTRMADAYIQLITEGTLKSRKLAAKLITSIFNNEQVKKALKTTGGGALKNINLIFNQINASLKEDQLETVKAALNTDTANALAERIISGAIEDKSGKIAKNIQENFNKIRKDSPLLNNTEEFNTSVAKEIGEVITTEDFTRAGETLLKKGVLSRTKYLRLTLWHRWGGKKANDIIKMIGNKLYNLINPSTNRDLDNTSTGSEDNDVIQDYNAAIEEAKTSMTDENVLKKIIELQKKAQANNITLPPVEDMALSSKIFNQLIKEAFNSKSENSVFAQQQLKEKIKKGGPALARNIQIMALKDPDINFNMAIMKIIDPSLAQQGPEGHRTAGVIDPTSRPTGQEGDSGSNVSDDLDKLIKEYKAQTLNSVKNKLKVKIAKMVVDKDIETQQLKDALKENDASIIFDAIETQINNLRKANNQRTSPNEDPRQHPNRGGGNSGGSEGEGDRGGYEPRGGSERPRL